MSREHGRRCQPLGVTDRRGLAGGRRRRPPFSSTTPSSPRSGIEVSPLTMPLREASPSVPGASHETFRGLPGLLADSLPDRYGNALIDAWLATQGRDARELQRVERLCYIGTRGMGALEFAPALGPEPDPRQGHRDRRAGRAGVGGPDSSATSFVTSLAEDGTQDGLARHPQRRHLGRRRAGQGGDRLEPGDQRGALRPGRRRPGLRVLAAEVRRRGRQQGQGDSKTRRATARSSTPTP